MRGLKGKNVLVTGGTSGIGQAIAIRFAEYGANVAINYVRAPEEATETEERVHACLARVRQRGVRDMLVRGDVSKEEDVVAMLESAVDRLGGIDVLVNNAGIQISSPSQRRQTSAQRRHCSWSPCCSHSSAQARQAAAHRSITPGMSRIS